MFVIYYKRDHWIDIKRTPTVDNTSQSVRVYDNIVCGHYVSYFDGGKETKYRSDELNKLVEFLDKNNCYRFGRQTKRAF